MDQTQTFEAGGCRAEGIKAGNKDALVIAQNNHRDFALAADQQPDLPVEFSRKKRYFPGQIVVDDIFRRDGAAIETFQGFDLLGAKSGCIAEYLVDGVSSLQICVKQSF